MSWLLIGMFCLAIVHGFNPAVRRATDATEDMYATPRMKVLIYDYAQLREPAKEQAQDRVSEIYGKVGVKMEWSECPTRASQRDLYPGCTGLEDATTVIVRIHSRVRTGMKSEAAAEAIAAARIINIYINRVQYEAGSLRLPPTELLSYVIAHEIGHLLLGPDSHALTGIMAARWRLPDLVHISQGGPGFTPRECERIREGIRTLQGLQGTKNPGSVPPR